MLKENHVSITMSTKNFTCTNLGANLGLWSEKLLLSLRSWGGFADEQILFYFRPFVNKWDDFF